MVADVFTGRNPDDGMDYFAVRIEKDREIVFLTKYPNCEENDAERVSQAMVDVMKEKGVRGFRLRRAVRVSFEKPTQLVFCAHSDFEVVVMRQLTKHLALLKPTQLYPTPVAPLHPGAH